jgi:hypothetical protein
VDDTGQIMLDQYEKLLGPRTRIVVFSHVSNALGTDYAGARDGENSSPPWCAGAN